MTLALQTLEYGGMLGIDREDPGMVASGGSRHNLAGGHEGFLVGQRDGLAALQGVEHGHKAAVTHHRAHHYVVVKMPCGFGNGLGARRRSDARTMQGIAQRGECRFVAYHHKVGVMA